MAPGAGAEAGRSPRRYGKVDRPMLEGVVYRSLGASRPEVLVGPKSGFDNAFVSVGKDAVMVVSTDPVSVIPRIGMKKSAWLSVHLVASDVATSGIPPAFAAFSFNFPAEMGEADRREYLRSIGLASEELGVAIVAGHTGSYPGGGFTVVGGGTMMGIGRRGQYVDPSMARAGDSILMTKGAAIEATATLAWSFPKFTEREVGKNLARRARLLLDSCTTVKEALVAGKVGLGPAGVTSMHDATEGGVLGGLGDMAAASGAAFHVEQDKIFVSEEARAVCGAFGIDPLSSLSEGTLLLTCHPGRVDHLKTAIEKEGLPVFEVGSVRRGAGLWMTRGRRPPAKVRSVSEGYWDAYAEAVARGRL
ncbi:MAG: AIR synthase [Thaumarchaeota archaeon]|nr:AIR synthase [Nitrososphaerota archaeon]